MHIPCIFPKVQEQSLLLKLIIGKIKSYLMARTCKIVLIQGKLFTLLRITESLSIENDSESSQMSSHTVSC